MGREHFVVESKVFDIWVTIETNRRIADAYDIYCLKVSSRRVSFRNKKRRLDFVVNRKLKVLRT
jgi:hypothetical protein